MVPNSDYISRSRNLKEISLPSYMSSLSQEEVDELVRLPNADKLIIACGIHPKDGSLMMLTASTKIFSITPNGKMKPIAAEPIEGGAQLKVEFCLPYGLHIIDSDIALAIAEDEISELQLQINGAELGTLSPEY